MTKPAKLPVTGQVTGKAVVDKINEVIDQSLGKDETAVDSGKFGGKTPENFVSTDSEKLGGQLPAYYAKAADLAKAGGDPLLWPRTSPSRAHIQAGYAPLDGQELSRALYPDAWAAIQAGAVPVVTESDWQADPLKRGAWTYGNGTTTFRMPDWNGKSAGSKGAVFVRGDGALSAGTPGLIQQDAFQGHEHRPAPSTSDSAGGYSDQRASGGSVNVVPEPFGKGITSMSGMGDARYGLETRPLNVTSVWVCRLFGAVTNPGAADAAQLATEVARLWAQKLDSSAAFGISQEPVDVTTSRLHGVAYYNTTGRPITLIGSMSTSGLSSFSISINDRPAIPFCSAAANTSSCGSVPIPVNAKYVITIAGQIVTKGLWELR